MSVLKPFERTVLEALLSECWRGPLVRRVLDEAAEVTFEHTGVGYFLTVRHGALPDERIVCDKPRILGSLSEVECGFVAFLERGELTLECYTWNDEGLPADFRDREVKVGPAP